MCTQIAFEARFCEVSIPLETEVDNLQMPNNKVQLVNKQATT